MSENELRSKTKEQLEEMIFNLDMQDTWNAEDYKYNAMLHKILKEKGDKQ